MSVFFQNFPLMLNTNLNYSAQDLSRDFLWITVSAQLLQECSSSVLTASLSALMCCKIAQGLSQMLMLEVYVDISKPPTSTFKICTFM